MSIAGKGPFSIDREPMVADILGIDRDGWPVLFVSIEARAAESQTLGWFFERLSGADESVAFGMLVGPESIRIYSREAASPHRLIAEFETVPVIRHYVPDFTGKPRGSTWAFERSLTTYTEAWLRDLIFSWKQGEPPMRVEIARIGLLDRLDGGDTRNRRREESAASLR